MGVPNNGWFITDNPNLKWMITRGTRVPLWLRKPPYALYKEHMAFCPPLKPQSHVLTSCPSPSQSLETSRASESKLDIIARTMLTTSKPAARANTWRDRFLDAKLWLMNSVVLTSYSLKISVFFLAKRINTLGQHWPEICTCSHSPRTKHGFCIIRRIPWSSSRHDHDMSLNLWVAVVFASETVGEVLCDEVRVGLAGPGREARGGVWGVPRIGLPKNGWSIVGKLWEIPLEWMMNRGTPILGNPHMDGYGGLEGYPSDTRIRVYLC